MSLARRLLREQMKRARRLWDKLARKGKLSGYACLTCEEWLGEVLIDEDDRAALYGAHSLQCKGPMISQLAPPIGKPDPHRRGLASIPIKIGP